MGLALNLYPMVYKAKYLLDGRWLEEFLELEHLSPQEEDALPADEYKLLMIRRNNFSLPSISATSQYGYGVFEGGKAFPRADGSIWVFRPDEGASRMHNSMEGLLMPSAPVPMIHQAIVETVGRNARLGFMPRYNKAWEADDFLSADAVYIRPFTYGDPELAPETDSAPWLLVACSKVGSYYDAGAPADCVVTRRIRATRGGTGWIKCASNYAISAIAKKEATDAGYIECVFLDAEEQKYIEECTTCNFFAVLQSGELVTPELSDTILPGITRKSILTLAKDLGLKTVERKLSIEEVMSEAKEIFVCGTAAALSHMSSITYKGKKKVIGGGQRGEITSLLSKTLRGLQYGLIEDKRGWLVKAC